MIVVQSSLWQGTPKEARFELFVNNDTLTVLFFKLVPDKAIYLLLEENNSSVPKWYKFPWSDESAQNLLEASEEAKQSGTKVVVNKPFRKFDDEAELEFDHEAPTSPLELKD